MGMERVIQDVQQDRPTMQDLTLPPRESLLHDPYRDGRLDTPVDGFGRVEADKLLLMIRASVEPGYDWSMDPDKLRYLERERFERIQARAEEKVREQYSKEQSQIPRGKRPRRLERRTELSERIKNIDRAAIAKQAKIVTKDVHHLNWPESAYNDNGLYREYREDNTQKITMWRREHNHSHELFVPAAPPEEDVMHNTLSWSIGMRAVYGSIASLKKQARGQDHIHELLAENGDRLAYKIERVRQTTEPEFQDINLDNYNLEDSEDMMRLEIALGRYATIRDTTTSDYHIHNLISR